MNYCVSSNPSVTRKGKSSINAIHFILSVPTPLFNLTSDITSGKLLLAPTSPSHSCTICYISPLHIPVPSFHFLRSSISSRPPWGPGAKSSSYFYPQHLTLCLAQNWHPVNTFRRGHRKDKEGIYLLIAVTSRLVFTFFKLVLGMFIMALVCIFMYYKYTSL